MRHRSLLLAVLGTALLATALATFASAEIDALSLLPQPADEPRDTAPYKIVVEAAAGQAERRYGLGSRTIGRAALDLQSAGSLVNGLRGVFSARLDATDPQDSRISGVVLSLREAYMTWQGDTGATVVEFGRINLRSGPGYGFNPTDFFRDNALRTITTANPFSLRENRLGTVMLRGQHIWDGAALSLALAPEISARRSDAGLSADWGATNGRGRALLSLSSRIRDIASGQLLLFKENDHSPSWGASGTALLSDAAVGHVEWSRGNGVSLIDRSIGSIGAPANHRNRFAAGLTYTTLDRLSVTIEVQYNGFALDSKEWNALQVSPNQENLATYYLMAQELQDTPARRSLLIYATRKHLGVQNLDLTVLMRLNHADHSRMFWADLRYRMQRVDVGVQIQKNIGRQNSEFGIIPIRTSVGLITSVYF